MRICFIVARLYGPFGGARHVLNTASELGKLGNDVYLYTHKFSPDCSDLITSENVKVIETGYPAVNNHNLARFLDYMLLPNLVTKISGTFDVIEVWGSTSVPAIVILRKFRKGYRNVPIIYGTGEPPRFAYDLKSETLEKANKLLRVILRMVIPIVRYVDSLSVRSADEVIVNSDWVAEQFKEMYGKGCQIIYPGVEINRFGKYSKQEARKLLGLDDDSTLFLSVSLIHARKRIDEALRLYKEYSKDSKKPHFVIVGDGPEMNNLKELSAKLDLTSVRFAGRLSDKEITLYYQAADYFIFTAKNEPFGIAPLEAKVAGCKIIPEDRLNPIISWEESAKELMKFYEQILL